MENLTQRSIASLVLENHRIVPVLEKYSIDFCCRGKMNLPEACREKGIEMSDLMKEIESVGGPEKTRGMPFSGMTEDQLVSHIVTTHHYYVKNSMPVIANHLEKVAGKHGETHPYMVRVKELFRIIHEEMDQHMNKEEAILFPGILELKKNKEAQKLFSTKGINELIAMMELEHEQTGDALFEIRKLTSNYSVPPGACTTFRLCLSELKEFEEDLHKHVHLENNILFPKVLRSSGSF